MLDHYAPAELSPDAVLLPGKPPIDALTDLLERAARTYAADPEALGCLVLESARGSCDAESVRLARFVADSRRAHVRDFVATTHPAAAASVTDFIASTMSGLSASAREGVGEARLLAVAAAAASRAIPFLLSDARERRSVGGAVVHDTVERPGRS